MKKFASLFLACTTLLAGLALSSCSSKEETPDLVTEFTINAETGDFSFKGVSEAKNYYVRVYEKTAEYKVDDEGNEVLDDNGNKIELTLDEKMPVAARRVRHKVDVTDYEGTVTFDDLVAGTNYQACVYTYNKNSDGDLIYAYTDPIDFVYKTAYATPTIDADGITASLEEGKVKLVMNDDFLSVSTHLNPNYKFAIYDGTTVVAQTTYLGTNVTIETTESTNQCGQLQTTTTYVTDPIVFDSVDTLEYNLTVTILSTNSSAYYDSKESAPVKLDDLTESHKSQSGGGGGGCEC